MKTRVSWIVMGLLLTGLCSPIPVQAGGGEITDGKVDLSLMFTYREADPDSWIPLLEESSRLLYNATNGQLQIGRVRVLTCAYQKDQADIWILNDNSGAFANLLGLGAVGHIYLSQTHKSTSGGALGQFGLVHEFGHYGFGAFDEYKGISQSGLFKITEQLPLVGSPHQFCVSEGDSVTCLMDGGTLISPNHLRTEFCTDALGDLSSSHNTGIEVDGILYINSQEALNGESCWETVARTVGLVPPEVVDTSDPPGLEPIEWEIVPSDNRITLCLDRSASMTDHPEGFAFGRELAQVLVELMRARKTIIIDGSEVTLPGDYIGLTSFAHDSSLDLPMEELVDDASKDSAQAVIGRIVSEAIGILSTDMGVGLVGSLDEILAQGDIASCSEAVVLLSDGGHNLGADPTTLVPEFRARGVKVYAVALGPGAETELLEQIADSTGGQFFIVTEAEEIPGVAASLSAALASAGTMYSLSDSTNGQDEFIPILADSFLEEITVFLEWDQGILDMDLTTPGGEVITVESAAGRQDVEAARDSAYIYIRVVNPEEGEWIARVSAVEIPGVSHFMLTVFDASRSVSMFVSTDQTTYTYPEPVHLRVDLIADVPVAGAMVEAVVERPVGGPVTIPLFDDGADYHGDEWPEDGVYNTLFQEFTGDGTYTFNIHATNVNGSGPDPNLPFIEDGPGPPPLIPPFDREAEVSVVIGGMGDFIIGDLDFEPRTLNLENPGGRATARIELPSPYDAWDIDPSTILLNGLVEPLSSPIDFGDEDEDGINDLTVKFLRADLIDILPDGMLVPVRLTGDLTDGTHFEAADSITVLNSESMPPLQVFPDTLQSGGTAILNWEVIPAEPITYRGFLSLDDGMTWTEIFDGVSGAGEFVWEVTAPPSSTAKLMVQADSPEGVMGQSVGDVIIIEGAPSGVGEVPVRTLFLGLGPNPSRGATELRFALAAEGPVRLEIYDIAGRLVRRLTDGRMPAGIHAVRWDGTDGQGRTVASGIYLYSFEAGSYRANGRMMRIR